MHLFSELSRQISNLSPKQLKPVESSLVTHNFNSPSSKRCVECTCNPSPPPLRQQTPLFSHPHQLYKYTHIHVSIRSTSSTTSKNSGMDPSNAPSLFPLETCPPVSDAEFNLFHTIDRRMYDRLINHLGRDPVESIQVLAFWLWLERQSSDMFLIKSILSMPPGLINELAEEAVLCLKYAENDCYPYGPNVEDPNEITLLPDLMGNRVVNLRFFHDNRIAVLRGVSMIVNTVCNRAFSDIPWRPLNMQHGVTNMGGQQAPRLFAGPPNREVGESSRMGSQRYDVMQPPPGVMVYQPYYNIPFAQQPMLQMAPPQPPRPEVPLFPIYDLGSQRQFLVNELGDRLSQHLTIGGTYSREEIPNVNFDEEEKEIIGGVVEGPHVIAADDRTIFLTFSKGYPISEDEVRDFFTRRFGDFIEDLIMQEVGEEEQSLYARMVARTPAVIEGIVGGNKAKYSINGKHVWARKYVKKTQPPLRSPPRGGGEESAGVF